MFGAEVGDSNGGQELANLVVVLEVQILDFEPFLAAQSIEVLECEHANVWRVVPFVRQFLGFRHATMEHKASACCPMSEIGEGDDGFFGDSQKFVQKGDRITDFLNGAVDDGVIETFVLDVCDAAVIEVALDHLYVFFKAVEDSLDVLFDAEACDFLFAYKIF